MDRHVLAALLSLLGISAAFSYPSPVMRLQRQAELNSADTEAHDQSASDTIIRQYEALLLDTQARDKSIMGRIIELCEVMCTRCQNKGLLDQIVVDRQQLQLLQTELHFAVPVVNGEDDVANLQKSECLASCSLIRETPMRHVLDMTGVYNFNNGCLKHLDRQP